MRLVCHKRQRHLQKVQIVIRAVEQEFARMRSEAGISDRRVRKFGWPKLYSRLALQSIPTATRRQAVATMSATTTRPVNPL